MAWQLLVLLVLIFLIPTTRGDATVGGPPNAFWTCEGCQSDLHASTLFGYIHDALNHQMDDRLVYLSVDMSWVDGLLLPDARVSVKVVPEVELATFAHPATSPSSYNTSIGFHLVVSELPKHLAMPRDLRHRFHHNRRQNAISPSSTSIFNGTDAFLIANPCWVPLSEPVLVKGMATSPLLLLVALPYRPLGTTCAFLQTLTASQFPALCKYDNASMSRIHLPNIGFASTVVQLVDGLVDVYCNECVPPYKVFLTPQAEDFYSRKINITDPHTGVTNVSHSGWAWADPISCPYSAQIHDPWSCNFLPLTNCSNRFSAAPLPNEQIHIWYTPTAFLTRHNLLHARRVALGDSPLSSNEVWSQTRFSLFAMRPNAAMRLRIRASFRQIVQLDNSQLALKATPSHRGARVGAQGSDVGGEGAAVGRSGGSASTQQSPYSHAVPHLQQLHHSMTPCAAVHIRHGDGSLDHRAQTGVNRSAESHLFHAQALMRALGSHKVFLASDNVTLAESLDLLYPHLSIFFQRRPMSQRVAFFQMFTHRYDSKDNEGWTEDLSVIMPGLARGPANNITTNPELLNESVAATLSHILADWRVASLCSAIVGAFDSGYSQRMLTTMCGAAPLGQCPASIDLRKPN